LSPLELSGRACKYPLVVAMLPCPKVACTSGSVAPRSMAWDAWAWRNQCGETGASMPALAAARRTMPCTARGSSAAPPFAAGKHRVVVAGIAAQG
jgi:hypothetical protein